MKRIVESLLFALMAALGCAPQPTFGQSVTLPAKIDAKAGRPIFVSPVIDGDDVAWTVDAGLDDWVAMLPPDVQKNFGASKIFYADKGTYTVRAWTAKVIGGKAKLSDIAVCVITVDGGAPPVPPPAPPAPPPSPPAPPPPIPTALQVSLQISYSAELDPVKSTKAAALADLLGSAVSVAQASGKVTTAKGLTDLIDTAFLAHPSLGKGSLPTTVRAVGAYLATVLPTSPTAPADAAYWAKAAAAYGDVSTALKGVK